MGNRDWRDWHATIATSAMVVEGINLDADAAHANDVECFVVTLLPDASCPAEYRTSTRVQHIQAPPRWQAPKISINQAGSRGSRCAPWAPLQVWWGGVDQDAGESCASWGRRSLDRQRRNHAMAVERVPKSTQLEMKIHMR